MKINSIAQMLMLVGIMTLPACGMKVGVDDATINAVECTINKDCKSSDSSGSSNSSDNSGTGDTTGDTSPGNSDHSNSGNSADNGNNGDNGNGADNGKGNKGDKGNSSNTDAVTYQGSLETDQDSNGGISFMEPSGFNTTTERLFLGTFKSTGGGYSESGSSCFSQYNLPSIVRPYSHLNEPFIDFETNDRELAWIADLYEDDTFDFSVRFLDQFGHPFVDLDCTCEIVDSYIYYTPEEIRCSCAGDKGTCSLYYEMM